MYRNHSNSSSNSTPYARLKRALLGGGISAFCCPRAPNLLCHQHESTGQNAWQFCALSPGYINLPLPTLSGLNVPSSSLSIHRVFLVVFGVYIIAVLFRSCLRYSFYSSLRTQVFGLQPGGRGWPTYRNNLSSHTKCLLQTLLHLRRSVLGVKINKPLC
jgi:hypothetical protein